MTPDQLLTAFRQAHPEETLRAWIPAKRVMSHGVLLATDERLVHVSEGYEEDLRIASWEGAPAPEFRDTCMGRELMFIPLGELPVRLVVEGSERQQRALLEAWDRLPDVPPRPDVSVAVAVPDRPDPWSGAWFEDIRAPREAYSQVGVARVVMPTPKPVYELAEEVVEDGIAQTREERALARARRQASRNEAVLFGRSSGKTQAPGDVAKKVKGFFVLMMVVPLGIGFLLSMGDSSRSSRSSQRQRDQQRQAKQRQRQIQQQRAAIRQQQARQQARLQLQRNDMMRRDKIAEVLRNRSVPMERLQLLVQLGDPQAEAVLGVQGKRVGNDAEYRDWIMEMGGQDRHTLVRMCAALGREVLPGWEQANPQEQRPRELLEAIEAWVESPTPTTSRSVDQRLRLLGQFDRSETALSTLVETAGLVLGTEGDQQVNDFLQVVYAACASKFSRGTHAIERYRFLIQAWRQHLTPWALGME